MKSPPAAFSIAYVAWLEERGREPRLIQLQLLRNQLRYAECRLAVGEKWAIDKSWGSGAPFAKKNCHIHSGYKYLYKLHMSFRSLYYLYCKSVLYKPWRFDLGCCNL